MTQARNKSQKQARNKFLHRLWAKKKWEELGTELIPLAAFIADEIWDAGYFQNTEVTREELLSHAFEGMMVAIHAWRPSFHVPIATYTSIRIRWFIIQEMRSHSLQRASGSAEHISLETMMTDKAWEEQDPIYASGSSEDMLNAQIDFTRMLETLSQPGRDILLDTLQGRSLRQIAKDHRVSFVTIRKYLNKARADLRRALQDKG